MYRRRADPKRPLRESKCNSCGSKIYRVKHPDLGWDVALEFDPPGDVDLGLPQYLWNVWMDHGYGVGWAQHPFARKDDLRPIRLRHRC